MFSGFDFDKNENDNDNNENDAPKLEFLDYEEYKRLMGMTTTTKKKEIPKYKDVLEITQFPTNKHKIVEKQIYY